MDTLYEITENIANLLEAIDSGEIPEEAIKDTLDAAEGELVDKIDDIASYVKQLKNEAQAIRAEEAALASRRQAKERKVQSLTSYLFESLKRCGKSRVETPRNLLRISKNPPAVSIQNEQEFILWAKENDASLLCFPDPRPDKAKIKEAIKNGNSIPSCTIIQTESMRVG